MRVVSEMLKKATPGLREICKDDPGMFWDLYSLSALVLDDLIMFSNTGKRHREAGKKKYD